MWTLRLIQTCVNRMRLRSDREFSNWLRFLHALKTTQADAFYAVRQNVIALDIGIHSLFNLMSMGTPGWHFISITGGQIMKSTKVKKWVKNSFFELFVENRPHLKFYANWALNFFNFVNVSFRNWPVWIPVGSQKVVLNYGILKKLYRANPTYIKFKKLY